MMTQVETEIRTGVPSVTGTSLQSLRSFFNSGAAKAYSYRKAQLQKLRSALLKHEQHLYDALYADLKKNKEEAWVTEVGFVIAEINAALRDLRSWMTPRRTKTNLLNFPSSSFVMHEPLGVVLVIGPWNYPLQLLFTPLVGAMAAGNCTVLKGSEFSPATSQVMKRIIEENFPAEYILYVEGDGAEVVPRMMNSFTFDHVFFTGSTAVGKTIYQMAANNLVPVTLELGGKSPCIVDSDADIQVSARRITVTKFSNAGQMCVAPDYVLVHASVKEALVHALKESITRFYSANPSQDYNYCRIVHSKQFQRIINYLKDGNIIYGGHYDASNLYIEPTLMDNVSLDSPLMQEEIFGPVLPVISFEKREDALAMINKHKNPLSCSIFTGSKANENFWLENVAFGGGCVNNASWHLTNHHLPFGGRGSSGIGSYHGRYSFEAFSHKKAVMRTPTWFDPALKYPPFQGKLNLFRRIIR
jgi:aldehyde dehydrogenase (NAD+)